MVGNRSQGKSFSNEHGPFAGRGYWEDVSLAIQARHGMISFHMNRRNLVRTSTAIIRELVEFRRVLEHSGGALPPFRECMIITLMYGTRIIVFIFFYFKFLCYIISWHSTLNHVQYSRVEDPLVLVEK